MPRPAFIVANVETPELVCADVLTKYKREMNGPLDFSGCGVNRNICGVGDR
jgi:hypothetical protein